ncbi:MAG TPA: MATE family efflux transporter [Thioploca sp.]|nr:MATE family efflux transporter [Thioploca sp.]
MAGNSTETRIDLNPHPHHNLLETTKNLSPPSYGEILRFAVPMVLGLMMTALNSLIDIMFIGQLGTAQLAAIPLATEVYFTGWILLVGLLRNSIAFIGRAFGAGKYHNIGFILVHYQLLALLGLPLLGLFVQSWPLFSAIAQLDVAVDSYAWCYLKIRVWDAAFSLLLMLYSAFYQSLGNSRFPMLVSVGVLLLNVVLDYGLIFGKLGMPALGVEGSALATVFAQAFGALFIVITSFVGSTRARFGLRVFSRPDFNWFKKILRIGLPQGIGDGLENLAWVGFMLIIGRLGKVPLAANNIGIEATQLLYLPASAIGIVAASYTGRFLGAGRSDIARTATYRTLIVGIIYMGVLGIPLWFFGESIARLFTTDAAVVYQAGLMFKVMALYQIFDGTSTIIREALGAAGDTLVPTLLLVACAVGVMFPAAIIFSKLVEPGLLGAWLGAFIYIVVLAAIMMYRYRSNRWTVIFSCLHKNSVKTTDI